MGKKQVLLVSLVVIVVMGSGTGLLLLKNGLIRAIVFSLRGSGDGQFANSPVDNKVVENMRHNAEQRKYRQLASRYVSRMSLDDEIAQLLMVEYRYATHYSPDLDVMLHRQHVGGVILYREQINTAEQTIQDTREMQKRSTLPVFVAVDEEGWNVSRLTNLHPGERFYRKDADDIRATGDPNVATSEGQKVAKDLLALGINMNLAPDVDVSTDTKYIGYDGRSFGSTPEEVTKYAGPYMRAMQAAGVIGCIKHFPGIGSVEKGNDPHAVLPTITKDKDQLYQDDMAAFRHFIQSSDLREQASVVMPTDVIQPIRWNSRIRSSRIFCAINSTLMGWS